jgi:hypothetical protein
MDKAMRTLTKQAIGIVPGDNVLITDSNHASGDETTALSVDKVNVIKDMVYISGVWGVINFPKYTQVVITL